MDIKEVLKQIGKDVLNEESKAAISNAFESTVNEKVKEEINERVQLEVETALKSQDEEHTGKLEELIEAMDADHAEKFVIAVQKLDEDRSNKLQNVVYKYEKALKESASSFKDELVDQVSTYLDLYLEKVIPNDQISEAVENTRAAKQLNQIKQVVSVDEEYITENIKEALSDGKSIIERQKKELNDAIKENIRLSTEVKSTKSHILLSEKTSDLPEKKKEYIQKVLNGKTPEYIEENFSYVVEMFERDENEEVEILTEKAKQNSLTAELEIPESVVQDEVIPSAPQSGGVGRYLSEMEKQDRKTK